MNRTLLALAIGLCISTGSACAAAARGPENLNFAAVDARGAPVGWRLVTSDSLLYRMIVRPDSTSGGKPCLVLSRPGMVRGDYGIARQLLDARPWRGRRLEFAARLSFRGAAVAGWSNMWISIADARQHLLRNETINDRHFTTAAWQPVKLIVDVPAQADSISLGFMLIGSGETWVSDADFRDVGAAGEGDEPPHPLSDRGLMNLVAFTRLLGYVRYFDPADSAAATDWDAFAIAAVDSAEAARTPGELAATLTRMFRPLDPALRIGTSPVALAASDLRPAEMRTMGIVAWSHHGWAAETDTTRIYWSRRDTLDARQAEMQPGPARSIAADLGGGVWCAVPTSLWLGTTVPCRGPRVSAGSRRHGRADSSPPATTDPRGWPT